MDWAVRAQSRVLGLLRVPSDVLAEARLVGGSGGLALVVRRGRPWRVDVVRRRLMDSVDGRSISVSLDDRSGAEPCGPPDDVVARDVFGPRDSGLSGTDLVRARARFLIELDEIANALGVPLVVSGRAR